MSVRGEMGVLREKKNTQGILEARAQTLSLLGKSCNHLELIRLSQAGQRVCPSSGEWNCEGSILYTFCLLHLQVTGKPWSHSLAIWPHRASHCPTLASLLTKGRSGILLRSLVPCSAQAHKCPCECGI